MVDKLKNGTILGALFGLVLTYPVFAGKVTDILASLLPVSAQFLGSFSLPFYGIVIGAIVGYFIDRR